MRISDWSSDVCSSDLMPATFIRVIGTKRTWMYETEAEDSILGRPMYVPQGRTLGGGSSVNAMIYIRGQREDYDGWAASGCDGWGYDAVLPVFRRAETNQRPAGQIGSASCRVKECQYV